MYVDGEAIVHLTKCWFDHNDALFSGGGAIGLNTHAKAVLYDVRLSHNKGTDGGGIGVHGQSELDCTLCDMHENEVPGSGGALQVGDGALVTMRNSILERNVAATGGALEVAGAAHVYMHNMTVFENTATAGGVILVLLGQGSDGGGHAHRRLSRALPSARINAYGRAIAARVAGRVQPSAAAVAAASLARVAGGRGSMPVGTLRAEVLPSASRRRRASSDDEVTVVVSNSRVTNNTAAYGGVVNINGPYTKDLMAHVNFTASRVGWNHATQGGGVLHWTMTDHPSLTTNSPFNFLSNCKLYNNTAVYNGPVVATGPTRLFITTNLGHITDTVKPFSLTVASAQQVRLSPVLVHSARARDVGPRSYPPPPNR